MAKLHLKNGPRFKLWLQKSSAAGKNIYIADLLCFSVKKNLMLFGEPGRRRFLQLISEELEIRKADITHRKLWRDLLAKI